MAKTPGRAWIESGWGIEVKNRDQLLRAVSRISTLQSGRVYAWRGQSSARYEFAPSLYRWLAKSGPASEQTLRDVERKIIREARKYGLGRGLGSSSTDAHLLATLQHHGVPTRLLDVTSNPFTALWFATRDHGESPSPAGVLFAVDVTDLPWIHTFDHGSMTYASLNSPLSAQYDILLANSQKDGRAFRLIPAVPDPRMLAQEGFFIGSAVPGSQRIPHVRGLSLAPDIQAPGVDALARLFFDEADRGAGRPMRLPFLAIYIPPKVKRAMADPLKGTFNRRRRVLFPDVDGFQDAFDLGELDLDTPEPPRPYEADL